MCLCVCVRGAPTLRGGVKRVARPTDERAALRERNPLLTRAKGVTRLGVVCSGFTDGRWLMRPMFSAVAVVVAVATGACAVGSTMPRRRSMASAAAVTAPMATSADDSVAVMAVVTASMATSVSDGSA